MAFKFIFMLTRNDRTVKDAADHVKTALACGVRHIGFKDIGLPVDALKDLNREIKAGGATSYLEVVSLDIESEMASATAAREIGVDFLLGGTNAAAVVPILHGSGIKYYPFPGEIIGHPSVLGGSVDNIVSSAIVLAKTPGVDGLDLLAYRFNGDVADLMKNVCKAVNVPVIMAGSIDTPQRIEAVAIAGSEGFTIGTAALDGVFPSQHAANTALKTQLDEILQAAQFVLPVGKVSPRSS